MRIQLENIKDFKAALRYMDNLSFEEVSSDSSIFSAMYMCLQFLLGRHCSSVVTVIITGTEGLFENYPSTQQ